jgi:DNA-binding NarL/FixJ family response regulator
MTGSASEAATATMVSEHSLVIAIIDHFRFSRECLVRALKSLNSADTILSFAAARVCVASDRRDLDVILYYSHGTDASRAETQADAAAIHRAYPAVPLLVLSDADDLQQPGISRGVLESGADDFIPTRTRGIFTTIGELRFAKQGGNLAPVDQPAFTRRPGPAAAERPSRLTPRELTVLAHLQRGKANKLIAHDLSMSENTVKIHIRNIMRKTGSTNRTQAVDKARKLCGGTTQPEPAAASPRWCRRKPSGDRRVGS